MCVSVEGGDPDSDGNGEGVGVRCFLVLLIKIFFFSILRVESIYLFCYFAQTSACGTLRLLVLFYLS